MANIFLTDLDALRQAARENPTDVGIHEALADELMATNRSWQKEAFGGYWIERSMTAHHAKTWCWWCVKVTRQKPGTGRLARMGFVKPVHHYRFPSEERMERWIDEFKAGEQVKLDRKANELAAKQRAREE